MGNKVTNIALLKEARKNVSSKAEEAESSLLRSSTPCRKDKKREQSVINNQPKETLPNRTK